MRSSPSNPFTLINECHFAGIDFESAGSSPGATDHPVQVGIAQWSASLGWDTLWTSYIACSAPITWSAQRIHGIGPEDLKGAPSFASLWPDISQRLSGRILVGHNIGTEKRFLGQFPGHGFDQWIDTLTLSRQAYPKLRDYSLGSLCEKLGLEDLVRKQVPQKCWHDALYDAAASIVLLEHLIQHYQLERSPVEPLLAISSPR